MKKRGYNTVNLEWALSEEGKALLAYYTEQGIDRTLAFEMAAIVLPEEDMFLIDEEPYKPKPRKGIS